MKPEGKDKLKPPQQSESAALAKQTEELVLTSKRLVAEMEALTARARELAEQRVEIVKTLNRRK